MRKRIVLITAAMESMYINNLVSITSEALNSFGYDVIILTHFVNYFNESPYITGEEDVYSILGGINPDGVIIAGGSFYHSELVTEIENRLIALNIPSVALDYESKVLTTVVQDNCACFRMITEHFISEHGFRKIAFLSGPEGNIHTSGREEGYRKALAENGIEFDRNLVVYGDFWLDSAKKLAADIASGAFPRPEAVVCASDYMAFQLIISLTEAGVKVPEDISVSGYDGTPDIDHYAVFPTTVTGAYLNAGIKAAEKIHELVSGKNDVFSTGHCVPYIRTGMSCSCRCDMTPHCLKSAEQLNMMQKTSVFMCCNYASVMSAAKTMDDLAIGILSNLFLLDNVGELCVYLFSSGENAARKNVHRVFRYNGEYVLSGERIRIEEAFGDISEPSVYICTPLHHQENSLGFCVRRSTGKTIPFEPYYGEFCQIISGSINQLKIHNEEADRMQFSTGHVYFSALEAVRNKIYEEPQLQWDAEEQAAGIGISISHFRHLYKEFFAAGFSADVTDARLALARKLLKTTDLSVQETAHRCGYSDESYFMKLFKKHSGITALAYRKK